MLMPPVSRYMTDRPVTIPPTTTIADAHHLMRARHFRHLPVVDGGVICGVVSDRDLQLFESLALGAPDAHLVEEVMISDPLTVAPATPLDEVVNAMASGGFDSVLVADRAGLAGVFTAVDACSALARILGDATA
jgi:CBS domain-containing protein